MNNSTYIKSLTDFNDATTRQSKAILQIFFMDRRTWVLMCAMENDESFPLGTIMQDYNFFVLLCLQRLGPWCNIMFVVS